MDVEKVVVANVSSTEYTKGSFFGIINLIKFSRIDGSELASATNARIQTNNLREIIPAHNEVFVVNTNVVLFEIVCMKLRNVLFFM